MLVDSHCHLDFPDFVVDQAEIVARARRAGVGTMMTIATYVSRFDQVLAVAERFAGVVCTLGVHPHQAAEELELATEARLSELARHPKVVAIGECGLDFHYNYSPRAEQETCFRRQVRVSLATGLPLVIHAREADDVILEIVKQEAAGAPVTGVMHCFASSPGLAEQALALGLSLSFSGMITFKKSQALRDIAATVPLERLLVETDAPYLAPMPHRGKRNEPAYVAHTAEALARVKGVSALELAAVTTANFRRLFPRAAPAVDEGFGLISSVVV
ncbi:Uncharacterized metal-dependent hydrolase HI_0454 [uncultured Gammaproteobacteria bacterium]